MVLLAYTHAPYTFTQQRCSFVTIAHTSPILLLKKIRMQNNVRNTSVPHTFAQQNCTFVSTSQTLRVFNTNTHEKQFK